MYMYSVYACTGTHERSQYTLEGGGAYREGVGGVDAGKGGEGGRQL